MDEAWLSIVRLARDCGNISSLFPPGITRLWDLPHTLHMAISLALQFLSYEELKEEDRPPQHIWLHEERMKQWWQAVRSRHENPEYSDMPQNEALKEMFPGVNFG